MVRYAVFSVLAQNFKLDHILDSKKDVALLKQMMTRKVLTSARCFKPNKP